MPSNIEIKAQIKDFEKILNIAATCSQSEGEKISQVDTFFNVPNGRLKLREFENGNGQLIFYDRSNVSGPKLSNYSISLVSNAEDLKRMVVVVMFITLYELKLYQLSVMKTDDVTTETSLIPHKYNELIPKQHALQLYCIAVQSILSFCDCNEENTLSLALGILSVVKKKRTLFLVGQTRIHIDHVEGLGNYLEFEVVLKDNQSVESGKEIAEHLMEKFEISPNDLIAEAYVDHLLKINPNK